MTDTNDRNETGPTRKSAKGGFGQFSDQYRDRWAANHPNKRKATDAATDAEAGVQAPVPSAPVEDGADPSPTRASE